MDWYKKNIENDIRKEVKLLRDNGFNTESSCAHDMHIQCQYILDGEMKRLHNILFNNGYKNYTIIAELKVADGHSFTGLQIRILNNVRGD